jgi:hypothetical protein
MGGGSATFDSVTISDPQAVLIIGSASEGDGGMVYMWSGVLVVKGGSISNAKAVRDLRVVRYIVQWTNSKHAPPCWVHMSISCGTVCSACRTRLVWRWRRQAFSCARQRRGTGVQAMHGGVIRMAGGSATFNSVTISNPQATVRAAGDADRMRIGR